MSTSVINRTHKVVSIIFLLQEGSPTLYLMKDSFYYHFISIISCCGPYFCQGINWSSFFYRATYLHVTARNQLVVSGLHHICLELLSRFRSQYMRTDGLASKWCTAINVVFLAGRPKNKGSKGYE